MAVAVTRRSKYREERTLSRGLCRPAGQDQSTFRRNVRRLRAHFERFNRDVAEICQWLMALRPGSKRQVIDDGCLWDFFLSPSSDDESEDTVRRIVFDVVGGWLPVSSLESLRLSKPVEDAVMALRAKPMKPRVRELFERLHSVGDSQRAILLKAAVEWIVAKYVQNTENWKRQWDEWEKEKTEWETRHPELTREIIETYDQIFGELGVREKNPRICSWETLKGKRDDCEYAGQRLRVGGKHTNHSPLCVKYRTFQERCLRDKPARLFFEKRAKDYLSRRFRQPGMPIQRILSDMFGLDKPSRDAFEARWQEYLAALGVAEDTILTSYAGEVPHCLAFSADRPCQFNKHTDLCVKYRKHLQRLSKSLVALERVYRDWRKKYLSGPSRPQFTYPSSEHLPLPKIFGEGYAEMDFAKSLIRLRLDDYPTGGFVTFGFKPWPTDYDVQPESAVISSVQIHFVGTRARVGFRFQREHTQSCFKVSQDELDELRSCKYPRPSQDQLFLDAARKLLLDSLTKPVEQLKIVTVDLGTDGASVALFEGHRFVGTSRLKVVKSDELRELWPQADAKSGSATPDRSHPKKRKGLSRDHWERHLVAWAAEASRIAGERQGTVAASMRDHDLRRFSMHIRWMIRDWARLNASQIIKQAVESQADLLVFESHRGSRLPGSDKVDDPDKKRRLAFLSHGHIKRKVKEKAVERGMRVVTAPFRYSSQTCSECGKTQQNKSKLNKNKKDRKFVCETCGFESNSDDNAARVMGKVFWGQIRLPVVPD